MNRLDKDLREALKRQQPPLGFADRVLARTRATEKKPGISTMWRWAAAAAAVLVLTAGIFLYRENLRESEGEKAKDQVMYALRLTGSKLREVKTHLEN